MEELIAKARVLVEALPYIWRDKAKLIPQALVKIEMINRAGHSIPDG